MKYTQGDIVLVNFLFPDGSFKEHFSIIVSNDELQQDEEFFYLAMISTKNYFANYAYELKDEMLTKAMPKKSYVKCQLLTGFTERDVIMKYGRVRKQYMQEIIDKIKQSIF